MSSDDVVIRLRGAGKRYNLYDQPIDRLKQALNNRLLPARLHKRYYREHWAVHGVDLDIGRGETVGIVGANGSGKSTLLQMICGTLQPTEGDVQVAGRIAPLLQLGAGFNPEFTGRENVRLNAGILGLSDAEIDARFDAIVAFADIGDMLERPVKLYSSGMYARLAFAVAINVDPDILVIDESLAVGDEAFQRKCYARIEAIRSAGATVLFVSHASGIVQQLCSRAVLLDRGELLQVGEPPIVIQNYQRMMFASPAESAALRSRLRSGDALLPETPSAIRPQSVGAAFDPALVPKTTVEYASRGATISDVRITDDEGAVKNVLERGKTYCYEYTVSFQRRHRDVRFAMLLKTVSGFELAGQWHVPPGRGFEAEEGAAYRVRLPFRLPFAAGVYFANAGVWGVPESESDPVMLHRIIDAVMFRVQPTALDRISHYVDITADSPSADRVRNGELILANSSAVRVVATDRSQRVDSRR